MPLCLVLAVITLLFFLPGPERNSPDLSQPSAGALIMQETDPFLLSEYWIRDFRLKQRGVDAESTISASLLVQRKRVTRFFIYHNMRELYLQNFLVDAVHARTGTALFFAPLLELVPVLTALEAEGGQESLSGNSAETPLLAAADGSENGSSSASPSDLLSRIVARPAILRVTKGACSLALSGARFRVEFKEHYAVLEGNVTAVLSSGQQYKTQRLIMDAPKDGLFFEESKGLFRKYMMESGCRLKRTKELLSLQVTDALEEQEQKMLDQLGPKLPLHIRLLLGSSEIAR